MATSVKIPDPVYDVVEQVADDHDMSRKEAVRKITQEAGYNV